MATTVTLSSKTIKFTFYLLLLAITLGCASSARVLDEVGPQPPIDTPDDVPDVAPVTDPSTTSPSGQVLGTTSGGTPIVGPSATLPNGPAPVVAPIATTPPDADVEPVASTPATTVAPQHPPLSFFMHDILGGTSPSGRVVTGIVANSDVNNLPFSKPNNQVLPINGGVPLNSLTGVINNNNAPFLVGLNGSPTSTVIQNSGNNNVVSGGNNLPFVSAGQLPAGLTLQQLMFGSITVVDNELTEGHELGSAVLGRAQGFYLASSLDGTSHTLVLTALFHGSEHEGEDTISFFGVHRTGSPVSPIAIVGGTGMYEDAKGYATIETLPQHDQHTTDGVETITQFNVYLTP
ncbi:disease resistance-responsive (dirigent-like protein) family protein [Actinidia rufa]|uniref:Dirigent protein n=1 Tax=Actinidia rufa TaxID=165716 RepID=A0A7J0E725_9ERIC|nr:disease resistance-responsive (dirigent-like protein) family protein [Actinidia rufa]